MVASQGDGSRSGWVQGGGFDAIQDYFQRQTCKHCCQNYTSDGIELLRQEPGVVVVKVGCALCGQPLGIALVGMSLGNAKQELQIPTGGARTERRPYPADWTKKDIERLANKKPIGYDDVLCAHEFFADLGSDWAQHLPKTKRRA